MKKLFLTLILATMFVACDDGSSPTSPSSTPTNSTPTYTTPTNTTTTTKPTTTTTVLYDVMMGGVCKAVSVSTGSNYTGTNSNGCQNDTYNSIAALYSNCDMSQMHVSEYDNLTLDRIRTMLISDFSFDATTASSIYGQAASCGVAFFLYNATSGLNFLYIERVGDGVGLVKKKSMDVIEENPSLFIYESGLEIGSLN